MQGEDRQRWLAELLFALTVLGRETYAVGSEALNEPGRMRRCNELMHRVAAQLRIEFSCAKGMSLEPFARMIATEASALGLPARTLRP
jgi:hypothetical protein